MGHAGLVAKDFAACPHTSNFSWTEFRLSSGTTELCHLVTLVTTERHHFHEEHGSIHDADASVLCLDGKSL